MCLMWAGRVSEHGASGWKGCEQNRWPWFLLMRQWRLLGNKRVQNTPIRVPQPSKSDTWVSSINLLRPLETFYFFLLGFGCGAVQRRTSLLHRPCSSPWCFSA